MLERERGTIHPMHDDDKLLRFFRPEPQAIENVLFRRDYFDDVCRSHGV